MVEYNSKGRQIHKGPRGGEYVLQGGRKVYTFKRASAAPPPRRASPPRRAATPPKAGYTKTPYTNVQSGLSVYLKESSGRYHVRGPPKANGKEPYGSISLEHRVRNASGTIKTLKEWLGKAPKKPRAKKTAPPTSPNFPGYIKTVFKAQLPEGFFRVYRRQSDGLYVYRKGSEFHRIFSTTLLRGDVSRRVKMAKEVFPRAFGATTAPPPPPPRRASPPRSAVVNYENMLKKNTSRLTMNKIRRYARDWLKKNVPANASYKRAALIIHPDKGNRTNVENQKKRVALFKMLGGLK